jgi:hypothetical protein
VPADAAARRLRALAPFSMRRVRAGQNKILSLLGFPDVRRDGRAQATRRPGSGLPDVQRVLADQATIDLADGGGLTFGQLPLLALSLVLFSSLLLVAALLPPGVVARLPLSPARFGRFRQPLALAAMAVLLPVAVISLAAALS